MIVSTTRGTGRAPRIIAAATARPSTETITVALRMRFLVPMCSNAN